MNGEPGDERTRPDGRPMPPSIPPRGAQPERVAPRREPEPQREAPRREPESPPRRAPERGVPRLGEPARPPRTAPPQAPSRAGQVRVPSRESRVAPERRALPAPTARVARPGRARAIRRRLVATLAVLLLALAAFAGGTLLWVEGKLQRVDALSGAPDTPGTTYLIVGSDSREGWMDDGTEGARTDTIMVLHQPETGPTALISIPRDSYVELPGYGPAKINAAFAYGGAPFLVQTVEALTGLTIDRYVEVGFTGVTDMVDALGGVELCYDADVNDPYSTLVWTAGCHVADGPTALAFSRMRYEDPLGDIGRAARQQQVVSAVTHDTLSPSTLLNPSKAFRVADAALGSLSVSEGTRAIDLIAMAQTFRSAQGADAVRGTPPIATIDFRVEGVGSSVLLDPEQAATFWQAIANGTYPPGTQVGGY